MDDVADLFFLLGVKAHDQRSRRRFQSFHFGAIGIDGSGLCFRCAATAPRLVMHARISDVAQRGFDRRPQVRLIRRQIKPLLDAGDLRVVEQIAGTVGAMTGGDGGRLGSVRRGCGRRAGLLFVS